jgi:hypothetical protein
MTLRSIVRLRIASALTTMPLLLHLKILEKNFDFALCERANTASEHDSITKV